LAHISKSKKQVLCGLNCYFRSSGAVPKSEAGYMADSTCFTHALVFILVTYRVLSVHVYSPGRTQRTCWSYSPYIGQVHGYKLT